MYYYHIPIMKDEVVNNLINKENGLYIDCTFGSGGHSRYILSKLDKDSKLISIDRDYDSYKISKKIKDKRFFFYKSLFSNLNIILKKKKIFGKINGIIIDLGLSNHQIKSKNRGFSFKLNGKIDMRMDYTKGKTLFDILNEIDINKLNYIIKNYGNEYFYKKISKNIIYNIKNNKFINNTLYLSNIIKKIKKNSNKNKKIHCSTKTFQSFRIYVNDEINELNILLNNTKKILSKNGKLLIISFNSIESRIIKNFYNKNKKYIKFIKKIKPSYKEIINNISSRSSILRIFEKI
ncbi:16S rRNA (cytosine(1402)-N(4))-methyltransferase RsmH [Candidatus Nardonella dryophthoridicola]|nr:16S rRNA (cytosine(1402)-N(4))-methyltransferase RsmH [Candidatus Nardonella dryophthoridicola]